MLPWVVLDMAKIPGDEGELRLKKRGSEYSIMLGSTELMNSRLSGSEEALARLSCSKIQDRRKPRILIGGLGMGFTLRAALAELGPDAQVTVAELLPTVVTWARGPMAELFGDCLMDPRVRIFEGDVGRLIRSGRSAYDAILLDVDNGPDGLTHKANDSLYDLSGLSSARTALSPGGVLAVWSSSPDKAFTQRMRKVGFKVDEVGARATGTGRGARHTIWIAIKQGDSTASQPLR